MGHSHMLIQASILFFFFEQQVHEYEPHDKTNKVTVHPAKTQMPRLNRVFAGHTATLLVLSQGGSYIVYIYEVFIPVSE